MDHWYVSSEGVRLRLQYRRSDRTVPSGSRPDPVLLIHGMGADHRTWAGTAHALRHAGHDTLTYDQRGHGRSGRSPDYLLDDLAADAERVVAAAGMDRLAVVGHSLGGQTALRLAWRRPELVSNLVLEEIPPMPLSLDQVHSPADLPLTPRRILLGAKQVVESPGAVLRYDRAVHDRVLPQFVVDSAWWERLRRTPQRTLVISGGPGDFLRPEYLRMVADAMPDARYAELSGGHTVHRESPSAFRRLLLDFLDGTPS
ncbi:alpha/beta fold hydrolase [Tsukamurella soli]|uniref:Esterase n=1 Tax=Tsukamurella soli TaxID=644556 RepID=A0ABP8JUB7_9ACTN